MGKIRIATPGEGAVGADESPLIRPVGKRPGNGAPAADMPMGLIDIDKRVAGLETQIETLEARVKALEALVAKLARDAVARETPCETATGVETEIETETAEIQSHQKPRSNVAAGFSGDDQPWIAAGVSRRQRKAQAALPANVIKLVPRNLTVRRPPLGKPAVVIVMAEVRRAAS